MKQTKKILPVRIGGISDGIYEAKFESDPRELELPEAFSLPVQVTVSIDKTLNQVLMHVQLLTECRVECDRCLAPVSIPVDQEFAVWYTKEPLPNRAADDDEVRLMDPHDPFVDLAQDVRDYALLGVPMRATCGEDENGAPQCKNNIAVLDAPPPDRDETDPRWDALKTMFKK